MKNYSTIKRYSDAVYSKGIEVCCKDEKSKTVGFVGEDFGIVIPSEIDDQFAVVNLIYSVAVIQLQKAQPRSDDTILVIGDGIEGLVSLIAAKECGLKLFYYSEDVDSHVTAKALGATVFASLDEMTEQLKELTDGEGPNIVIDLSVLPNIVSTIVNQVLSQAGRLVIGRRDKKNDSFQMRMGSYKELDLYGIDRCEHIVTPSEKAVNELKELTERVTFQ